MKILNKYYKNILKRSHETRNKYVAKNKLRKIKKIIYKKYE